MKTTDYPNGVTATYDYDELNRLDTLIWKNSSLTTIVSYDYDVYADGQRAKLTELSGKVTQWSYDNLNRLTTESIVSGYTHNYTYDLVGNRVTFDDGSVTYYQRNEKDQILAESPNIDYTNPSITYGYDDNGSLASKAVTGGDTTVYGYNLQNRLASVTVGINPAITYKYNPDGIRVSKQIGTSAANNFLVDLYNPTGYAQVVEDGDGQFVIGNDIIAQDTASGVAYFIYDGQGSVRYLADASGSLISGQTFDYDGYGNRTDTSAEQTNLLYTGEWYDADLDWNYNRDRWSIPSLGIFNQTDRYSGNQYDPQSLHKYAYCHGNPINGIDPSGKFFTIVDVLSSLNLSYLIDNMKNAKDAVIKRGVDEVREEMLDQLKDAFNWSDPPPVPLVAQYAETMWLMRLQMLGIHVIPLQSTAVGQHGPDIVGFGYVGGKFTLKLWVK